MGVRRLWYRLAITAALSGAYAAAAVAFDFVGNTLLGHPASVTPPIDILAAILIGAPVTFYLLRQQARLRDLIDARAVLELELQAALAQAQAAARAKSDFLANMSHELRTPLNAIIGFASILARSAKLHPDDARHVQVIGSSSEALLAIVNDVLDFSKLEAGQLRLEDKAFRLDRLLEDCRAILAEQAAAKGLAFTVVCEDGTAVLRSDPSRLRQVLLNLISNAVKFTAQGGVTVTARLIDAGPQLALRVEVADTGVGLAPEQFETVFDRFTQADASISRRHGGTGLGLAISKRILDAMGGRIGVESAPGQGATFWFETPVAVCDPSEEAAAATEAAPPLPPPVFRRVLVADDNRINRELLIALLEPFKVEIHTAADGAEAVEAALGQDFDLILMDMQMPRMDGLEATRTLRARASPADRRTPIVAITANAMPEQVAACYDAGMDDYVAKPLQPAAFLQTVTRWIEGAAFAPQTPGDAARERERGGLG